MGKKIILASLILIIIFILAFLMITDTNTVDIYNDGENISVETHTFENINVKEFNEKVCNLTLNVMENTTSNITNLKNGVETLCKNYGINEPKISIDSSIGSNQIPIMVHVNGTSMLPTLYDGQTVIVNKTHDIHVGDIVVAESEEYGGVIKRVDDIKGDSVHLVSDNKNISYEYVNSKLYEIKGISTWVNLSDINGVVISY